MPEFLKDAQDVIFVTAAQAFKEAIDAYKRGEFRETRGPVRVPDQKELAQLERVAAQEAAMKTGT